MQVFASSSPFFETMIARETGNIEQTPSWDHRALSDLYASRGESYLILNDDKNALEDFLAAHEHALHSQDQDCLSLRALLGAFLVYARLEDEAHVRATFEPLSLLIDSCSCCERNEQPSFHCCTLAISDQEPQEQGDWPILGPERIPIRECLDRVEATTKAIRLMIAAVPKSTIRALALTLIDQLETNANRCCRAGGLWKGCLQKLVNKLHYWNMLGIPSDASYYTGIHLMSLSDSEAGNTRGKLL
jgi:hypothetical protein